MTELRQVYKCAICGNITMVMHAGKGELVCCGQPMKLMEEQTEDWKTEKHVPVIEQKENGMILVKVGSETHPMTEEHYIEWIELSNGNETLTKFLKPGEPPEALFCIKNTENLKAREYCNIHGLWKN